MARKYADRGFGMYGSRRVEVLTYPTPAEELFATPIELPTVEPADPQIEYTMTAAHLPNGGTVKALGWIPALYAVVQNQAAAAQHIYWKLTKNGSNITSTQTVSSLAANNYVTITGFSIGYSNAIGDIIGLKLWAAGSDAYALWKGFAVFPTRIYMDRIMLTPVYVRAAYPTFSLGNPVVRTTATWAVWEGEWQDGRTAGTRTYAAIGDPVYGCGRAYNGDEWQPSLAEASATNYPWYRQNTVPTQITYTPIYHK